MSQTSRGLQHSARRTDKQNMFRLHRRATLTKHQLKASGRGSVQMLVKFKRTTTKNEAPVSIESEQRGVIVTATQVSMDVKSFRSAFKQEMDDLSECKAVADEVATSLALNEHHLDSVDKFIVVLKEGKIDANIQNKYEFELLETFCDKTLYFNQTMVHNIEKLVLSIDNHLAKFLLSFAEEANGQQIKCVNDYDERIKSYTAALTTKRTHVNELMGEFNDSLPSFVGRFLADADEMNRKMDDVRVTCLEMCDIMKRWSADDRAYPAKLWDEIISSNIVRGRMLEEMKRAQRRRDELAHGVSRRQMARDRLEARLEENKRERKKSNSHKDVVTEKINRLEDELVKTKKELEDTEFRFANRKSNSPGYLEFLENRIDSLKREIVKLTENTEAMKKQAGRYNKTKTSINDVIASLEKGIDAQDAVLKTFKDKLKDSDAALHKATEELKERGAKIAATKRIRDIKLKPTTLRKIYFQHLDPEDKDHFMEACKLVSKHIGNSWRVLYTDLPFKPIRDAEKRQQDVHHIYVSSLRRDQTIQDQALDSLKKWRVFNRRGNVHQLIHSLKRIEKLNLARKLENQIKTVEQVAVC